MEGVTQTQDKLDEIRKRNEELERENMQLNEKSFLSGRLNGDDSSFLGGERRDQSQQIDDLIREKDQMQQLIQEIETKLNEKEVENVHFKRKFNASETQRDKIQIEH